MVGLFFKEIQTFYLQHLFIYHEKKRSYNRVSQLRAE